jgi:multiple sugar transport system permease protein
MLKESLLLTLFRGAVLFILLFLVVVPVFWGLTLAFRTNEEIVKISGIQWGTLIPQHFTLENFGRFFAAVNILQVFPLTVFVCLSVMVVSLLVNALAAYPFARMDFRGKRLLFSVIIATMVLPIEILIVPLYHIVKDFGMMDTVGSLILPFAASGFGIFFLRQFFVGIPKEFDEAAVMDGGGHPTIFFKILLPLARAPLITLGIIIFLTQWDSFLVPVTFISSPDKMVLQVVIFNLYSHIYFNDTAILFAGIFVAAVPIIVLFLSIQKYYVSGISSSGIKG